MEISERCAKAMLKFLYERALANAGIQADIIITKKPENEKEKAS